MKAVEIMTTDVVTVQSEPSVREAARGHAAIGWNLLMHAATKPGRELLGRST
jgi:hypothetical protein